MDAKRVLLLDDDRVTLLAVSKLLAQHRHETTQCSDTAQGVSLAVRGGWDLIILDLSMDSPRPEFVTEFDGLKLLRWLEKAGRSTPVILLTACESSALDRHAKEAGAFAVVRKNEPPSRLLETVRLALEPSPVEVAPSPVEVEPAEPTPERSTRSLSRLLTGVKSLF